MSKSEIVKRPTSSLKERGQYTVALSLIGVMLYAVGFPLFFLLFVGALTYFVWKIFSSEGRNDVRRIFEFYLSSNEILRDDYRRWYGFEIQETIAHGEKIVRALSTAPPLVHFALGALYDRLGDHSCAVKHLSAIDGDASPESGIVFPTNELREYVRILRKIERSPAEAPQTSAAIRSLERLRKNKTKTILEKNRSILESEAHEPRQMADENSSPSDLIRPEPARNSESIVPQPRGDAQSASESNSTESYALLDLDYDSKGREARTPERKSISEVLHDIYDENVQ